MAAITASSVGWPRRCAATDWQEMIALSDRQRRRRALQQRELLVRECEGTRGDHVVFPQLAYMRARS